MKLADYQLQKQKIIEAAPRFRHLCATCVQPDFSCYCPHVQRFDPKIQFVILIHPIEVRRRIATGRMSHLCLENSLLVHGQDFSQDPVVNRLINDPDHQCFILYPGRNSLNLSESSAHQKASLFDPTKKPVVFVIDGTWATARRTVRLSENLKPLPRICFSPVKPSNFRVRKQPAPGCYSTIEAIHHVLELVGPSVGFDPTLGQQDRLLYVFDKMVERQLAFIERSRLNPELSTYRRQRQKQITPSP